jgi:hypothetical protein
MSKKTNLTLWDSVEKSDERNLRDVNYGARSFTTIDAYPQFKRATEIFGPMGIGWGLKDVSYAVDNYETVDKDGVAYQHVNLRVMATFWYIYEGTPGEFPVGTECAMSKKDYTKIAHTDITTKALSYIGFNSDVFMGAFDGNKYSEDNNKGGGMRSGKADPGFPAKKGSADDPGWCAGCQSKHITKGDLIRKGGPDGKYGSVDCWNKAEEEAAGGDNGPNEPPPDTTPPDTQTPPTAALPASISKMSRAAVLKKITDGEVAICGPDDAVAHEDLRAAGLGEIDLSKCETVDLKHYLSFLVENVPKK